MDALKKSVAAAQGEERPAKKANGKLAASSRSRGKGKPKRKTG
jgi:hypothetical protein